MIALASDGKLALAMRIAAQGDLATGAMSAEVAVVAASPCAVDGRSPTVAFEAVNTALSSAFSAADRHLTRRPRPVQKPHEVAKNVIS